MPEGKRKIYIFPLGISKSIWRTLLKFEQCIQISSCDPHFIRLPENPSPFPEEKCNRVHLYSRIHQLKRIDRNKSPYQKIYKYATQVETCLLKKCSVNINLQENSISHEWCWIRWLNLEVNHFFFKFKKYWNMKCKKLLNINVSVYNAFQKCSDF